MMTMLATLFTFFAATTSEMTHNALTEHEAEDIGIEAYIYGYPLVTMEMTKEVMTNIDTPSGSKAPIGQFANLRSYPDPSFTDVTAPNADTLYSAAWLDLSKEPWVLHLPEEKGRYYLMPMLSGWTNVFASLGTRTSGTGSADYLITGPQWKGKVPANMKEIKAPTNMVWIIGRTYSSGTPEDYQEVHAIQNRYALTPLSQIGKNYVPARGWNSPKVDTKTPVRDQVNKLDFAAFFNKLALLMKDNPPAREDAPIIAKMAKIGIVPGQPFDPNKVDIKISKALHNVPKLAQMKIMNHEKEAGEDVNGWLITAKAGSYGTDYLQRALVAAVGLGANLPEDAIYPVAEVDNNGRAFNGSNQYVIHFEKDKLPPVRGFWSITLYNDRYFFVANPLNRYSLNSRDPFKFNEDGSLDLYIQNESPGSEKESNWLPAPKGPFILMMRLYWPEKEIINGYWKPPVVKQMK